MAKIVDVTIRVADMREFQAVVSAAGNVVRAYEAVRAGGAGTALGVAIDGLRDAMRGLVPDDET